MSFSIISKLKSIPNKETDMDTSTYGWRSDDKILPLQSVWRPTSTENIRDMRGQTTFEIEFSLDCDHRKISYLNQKTNKMREMKVDLATCPLPWQLLFNLYDANDCAQLVSFN